MPGGRQKWLLNGVIVGEGEIKFELGFSPNTVSLPLSLQVYRGIALLLLADL